jgi:predicted GTPase
MEELKGYMTSNLKKLNNRQQSLMIMAMFCLIRQGRLNLLLIAETGTGKSAMAIAAVVYITTWCAEFILKRLEAKIN